VIGEEATPTPTPVELRAAALAIAAEAGLAALPFHALLTADRHPWMGVGPMLVPFVLAFVGAALTVCWFRSRRSASMVAAAAAVGVGLWLGRGDVYREVFAVILALVVMLRVVALGLRDWRDPVHASFALTTVVLGIEVVWASGAQTEWRAPLFVIVPVFFVGMLASRTTAVWHETGAGSLSDAVRARWIRLSLVGTGGLLLVMASVVALGVRGGALERLGRWVAPVVGGIVSFVLYLVAQATRPLFWLAERFRLDPDRVRAFLDQLRRNARGVGGEANGPGGGSLGQRLLGLVVFVAIAWALVVVIRRLRAPLVAPRGAVRETTSVTALPLEEEERVPTRRWRRSELPADTVRRWYAEVLLALDRGPLAKHPSATPRELAVDVGRAIPSVAPAIDALTHAYEEVRYGRLTLADDELAHLGDGQDLLLRTLASRPPEGEERSSSQPAAP
jgi:hypothetical protein